MTASSPVATERRTLSKCAYWRPRQAGTVRDLRLSVQADRAGQPRTQAIEATIETTSRPTAMKPGPLLSPKVLGGRLAAPARGASEEQAPAGVLRR